MAAERDWYEREIWKLELNISYGYPNVPRNILWGVRFGDYDKEYQRFMVQLIKPPYRCY
jgi:hypothetical protein